MWDYDPMKTTLEIPDKTFRRAKSLAASQGLTLRQLVTDAIEEKLRNGATRPEIESPAWMKLHGSFAKTAEMRSDTRRIQKLIDKEFERINPDDWK
jgi:hypothetical protein